MTALWIVYGLGVVAVIWTGWLFLCRRHKPCGLAWLFLALALGWPVIALAWAIDKLFVRAADKVDRLLAGERS